MDEYTQNVTTDAALVIGAMDQENGTVRNTLELLTTVSNCYFYMPLDAEGMMRAVATYEKGQKAIQQGKNIHEMITREQESNELYDAPYRSEWDYWTLIQEYAQYSQQQ